MYCHTVSGNTRRATVAYLIPFAMGQEVCSVTKKRLDACQNTHSIPHLNIATEIHPPSCGVAGSDVRAAHVRIGWEHPSFLVFSGVIVQNSRLELEVIVVFHDIVGIVDFE